MPVVIQSFFDYACPYCYLSEIILDRVAASSGVEVVRRAFQLRGSGSRDFAARDERLDAQWENTIHPMAEKIGVEIRRPTLLPPTRSAHEAAAWARQQGQFEPFHRRIFQSLFINDKDIADLTVLKEIAWQTGLHPGELEKALTNRATADEVDEDLLIAQTYGITLVPTFVIAGQQLRGIQEEETLMKMIQLAGAGKLEAETQKLPHLPVNIIPIKR